MNILVTGSSGFIGKHVVRFLREKQYNVFCCDRKTDTDIMMISQYDLQHVDCVIHLAAQTSVWNDDLKKVVYDNITNFVYLYGICGSTNTKFIYASSSCAINITSIYGLSKLFDDTLVKLYPIDQCVGLRFHNVYGKLPRPDTLFGKCFCREKLTLYNNGKNYRHFTYIDDVCRSIEKAIELPSGLYNVFNPELNSCIEFVNEVKKYRNLDFVLSSEERVRDKEFQFVDNKLENLISDDYTSIEKGMYLIFNDHGNSLQKVVGYQTES